MLTVLVLLLLGVALGRWRGLREATPRVLDAFVIAVALPGLILALVPQLEVGRRTAIPVAVAWAGLVLSALLVLGLSRLAGWDRRTTGTLLVVVPLGNTSFLGIPAVEAVLGADHVPYAIVYDQLGSFLAIATYAAFVAGRYGAADPPRLRTSLHRLVTFPPFVALVVGAVMIVTGAPDLVTDVAGRLGATVTPLAMVAIGMRLRRPDAEASHAPLAAGLGVRMVAVPLAVLGAMLALGGDGPAWETSVLEAAMPPMVTASVVAIEAGLDEHLAATLAGLGVVLAMVTLPLWGLLLGS